ncbi:MAG: hypothetical protein QW407_03635 [Thermofilaceae archaeon]
MRAEPTNAILKAVRDRLPSSTTAAGNLRVALKETGMKQPVDIQNHWSESVILPPSGARAASGNTADTPRSTVQGGWSRRLCTGPSRDTPDSSIGFRKGNPQVVLCY